jgi:hypothetical protein
MALLRREGLPGHCRRHLEPMRHALVRRIGILKGMRGSGPELGGEGRRINADDIHSAAGIIENDGSAAGVSSALLTVVVIPAVGQARTGVVIGLSRINLEEPVWRAEQLRDLSL